MTARILPVGPIAWSCARRPYNRLVMAPARSPASKRASRRGRVARLAVDAVRLTADRIVVQHPDAGERTSRGGLLIPATAAPAAKRCVWSNVVLVGPDVRAVRTGDRVLFLPQAGLELELDGDEYLLLRERDVQAVASAPESGDRAPGQYL
jgi:chaperonin GroES